MGNLGTKKGSEKGKEVGRREGGRGRGKERKKEGEREEGRNIYQSPNMNIFTWRLNIASFNSQILTFL